MKMNNSWCIPILKLSIEINKDIIMWGTIKTLVDVIEGDYASYIPRWNKMPPIKILSELLTLIESEEKLNPAS